MSNSATEEMALIHGQLSARACGLMDMPPKRGHMLIQWIPSCVAVQREKGAESQRKS